MLERGGRGLAWNERDAEKERDLGKTRREKEKKSEMEGEEREREKREMQRTKVSIVTPARLCAPSLSLSFLLVLRWFFSSFVAIHG